MTAVSIAEDLLLLVLDDESGKFADSAFVDIAVGGAVLIELSLDGAVELTEKRTFRQQKVVAADDAPELPPMLADALREIDERERSATTLVSTLGKHRRRPLLDRLVDAGMIRCEEDRVLGLFPRTRWPAEDVSHETEVRRKITQALTAEHAGADQRTAALIALLSALGATGKVFQIDGLSKRDIDKRAKTIADGQWASDAVRDAITASQAALVSAMTAATLGATAT